MRIQKEEIKTLVQNGQIQVAFSKALEIANQSGTYSNELIAFQARYALWERRDQLKTESLDQNDIEFHRIIDGFIKILDKIEEDFDKNNIWIKKQTSYLMWCLESWHRPLDEILGCEPVTFEDAYFSKIEAKIHKEYSYIIHWRLFLTLPKFKVVNEGWINKNHHHEYAFEIAETGAKVRSEKLKNLLDEIRTRFYDRITRDGLIVFDLDVDWESKGGLIIHFSTVAYPIVRPDTNEHHFKVWSNLEWL